jgi:hypothetical protein
MTEKDQKNTNTPTAEELFEEALDREVEEEKKSPTFIESVYRAKRREGRSRESLDYDAYHIWR